MLCNTCCDLLAVERRDEERDEEYFIFRSTLFDISCNLQCSKPKKKSVTLSQKVNIFTIRMVVHIEVV
jgi:hypothetical protein